MDLDFIDDMDLLEAVELYNNLEIIDESSYISKLALPAKVKAYNTSKGVKINGVPDLVEHHFNPGLRHIIQTSKDANELEYLRKDTSTIFPTLAKIKERIKLCKQLGETKKLKVIIHL